MTHTQWDVLITSIDVDERISGCIKHSRSSFFFFRLFYIGEWHLVGASTGLDLTEKTGYRGEENTNM